MNDITTIEGKGKENVSSQSDLHQVINECRRTLESSSSRIDLKFYLQPNFITESSVHLYSLNFITRSVLHV